MNNLMASIGWLLLHWSYLEAAINSQITELRKRTKPAESTNWTQPPTLGAQLKLLQQLHRGTTDNEPLLKSVRRACEATLRLARSRNAIAHRLTGADATTAEPFITCSDPQGPRQISATQLKKLTRKAEELRQRFAAFPTNL